MAKKRRESVAVIEEVASMVKRRRREEVSCELRLYEDPWTIKKRLENSDLEGLSRVILPCEQVEKHVLPFLRSEEECKMVLGKGGIEVEMKDLDTETKHMVSFKRWPSTGSYVLGKNWRSEFVKRRGLTNSDDIGILFDKYSGCFYFSVLSRRPYFRQPPQLVLPDPSLCQFASELTLGLSPSKIA